MNILYSQFTEKDSVNLQRVFNYNLLIKLVNRDTCPNKYGLLKPDVCSFNKELEKRKAAWVNFYIKLFAVSNDCQNFPEFCLTDQPSSYSVGQVVLNYASVTLGEGDASILFTAKEPGAAGNALTAAIVIEPDSTALSVAETDGDVVVTSGDKRRMLVTGTLDPDLTGVYVHTGTVNGRPSYRRGDSGPIIIWSFTSWDITLTGAARYRSTTDTPFPDGADWSGSAQSPATGTPSVTDAPATAAQAIALDQSALSVNLTLPVGTDGSASLAAAAATPLTGG